jgi:hypothetical protein
MWRTYHDSMLQSYGAIRTIIPFDIDTHTKSDGNDIIYGGDGDDRLYGGNGRDTIYGNDGDDELIGGGGDDILHGGAHNDICIGDWAFTYRTRSIDGQRWHWSLVTEDRVTIHDTKILSSALNQEWPAARWWLQSDIYAGYNNSSPSSYEISIAAMNITLGGNDVIQGGDGDDVADIINGESGNDIVVGDHVMTPSAVLNASRSLSSNPSSILPVIFHTLRITPTSVTTNLAITPNVTFGTAFIVDHYISAHELSQPLPMIHHLASWQSSTLHQLVNIVPGLSTGEAGWRPTVVLYGNVIMHGGAQYGNDKLYGGHDNDIIVGDSLLAYTWNNNHNTFFNDANQRVTSLSSSLSFRMSTLSAHSRQLGDLDCHTAMIACDVVDGNNGIDISVGDNMLLPTIAPSFSSITPSQYSNEMITHYNLITNVEGIVLMMEAAVAVSQYQVLSVTYRILSCLVLCCVGWRSHEN